MVFMTQPKYRQVQDSMGALQVPESALYGAQTQRAIENFPISGLQLPKPLLNALVLVKKAAARANQNLGLLDSKISLAIQSAADEVLAGKHKDQFPIDVFQTGSGTSSNMNVNEVLATLASNQLGLNVHPNDHVNMGQSSNDVFPTAIHLSAALEIQQAFQPAFQKLEQTILQKAKHLTGLVKTGRTHLMDAMPVLWSQELTGWAHQIKNGQNRIQGCLPRLHSLAIGGTAVGTGINADPELANQIVQILSEWTGLNLQTSACFFESLSSQDTAVELSGQLKVVAVSLMKICNDLRWMNSGPLSGIAEIALPALQPGSSIMPGKVNPVIPEAGCMVAAQVSGNDTAIGIGGMSGNFQLNVMLPMIAYNLLQSIQLLSNLAHVLADKAIQGFNVKQQKVEQSLQQNPILVTALNPIVGYAKGAEIAKAAYSENRAVLDVAAEKTSLSRAELENILNPYKLTQNPKKN